MFIFDNCNIMQEMWVLIFDCQLSLYSTAQVENFLHFIHKMRTFFAEPHIIIMNTARCGGYVYET